MKGLLEQQLKAKGNLIPPFSSFWYFHSGQRHPNIYEGPVFICSKKSQGVSPEKLTFQRTKMEMTKWSYFNVRQNIPFNILESTKVWKRSASPPLDPPPPATSLLWWDCSYQWPESPCRYWITLFQSYILEKMHLAFSKLLSKGDKREREWGYNLCSDSGSPGRAKIWPQNIRVKFSREKLGAYWRKGRSQIFPTALPRPGAQRGFGSQEQLAALQGHPHLGPQPFHSATGHLTSRTLGFTPAISLAVMTTGQPFRRPSPCPLHLDHSCWPRLVRPRGSPGLPAFWWTSVV